MGRDGGRRGRGGRRPAKKKRLGEIKKWRKGRDRKIMDEGRDLGANKEGRRGRVEVGSGGGWGGDKITLICVALMCLQ